MCSIQTMPFRRIALLGGGTWGVEESSRWRLTPACLDWLQRHPSAWAGDSTMIATNGCNERRLYMIQALSKALARHMYLVRSCGRERQSNVFIQGGPNIRR